MPKVTAHIPNSSGRLIPVFIFFLIALSTGMLSGCATSQSRIPGEHGSDNIQPVNEISFSIDENLDQVLMPIAEGYTNYVPPAYQKGLSNFFSNILYINVILNSFLQGKFDQALSDLARFLLNSTLGLGGFIDVATNAGLAKNRADVGQTLASWGVSQGSYVYFPVLGPNTARNSANIVTSLALNPATYLSKGVLIPVSILRLISSRADLLQATEFRDEAGVNSYIFTREAYLLKRNNLIYGSDPLLDSYEGIFEDDDAGGPVLIIE